MTQFVTHFLSSLMAQAAEEVPEGAAQAIEIPEGLGTVFIVLYLAILLLVVAGGWKMFSKAGQPGWGILVPILNLYFLCKVAGRPGWWVLLMFIPLVNLIVMIIISIDVAKAFGMGTGFGLGIFFLGFIFIPVLGFGGATYQGSAAVQAA